jgi:hypothetical protein
MKTYTFNELWVRLPESIRIAISKCEQNPSYHPEGNVDVHIRMVFEHAKENYGDVDLMIAAIFHDLGKVDTFRIHPIKGTPTSYGHESYAKRYIERYFDLYSDVTTNKEKIVEICENHMKAHKYLDGSISKKHKRQQFENLKYFDDIIKFSHCDDAGKIMKTEDLSDIIKNSISKIDDNLSYEDFAIAVAKIIKDDYGTHNYKPFLTKLKEELYENKIQ